MQLLWDAKNPSAQVVQAPSRRLYPALHVKHFEEFRQLAQFVGQT